MARIIGIATDASVSDSVGSSSTKPPAGVTEPAQHMALPDLSNDKYRRYTAHRPGECSVLDGPAAVLHQDIADPHQPRYGTFEARTTSGL
jgi:hypothetical protein